MEQSNTIFDTWYRNTTKMMDDWREMAKNVDANQRPLWDDAAKMQQKWIHDFQSMIQNMQNPFMPGGRSGFSQNTMKDVFENMLNSTDMYTRLYTLWQPVFDAMQKNSFRQEDFWKMINPQGFREFVDKLFGYSVFNPMKDFMDSSNQSMKHWFDSAGDTGKMFTEMFNNNPFANTFNMNPESMSNWYAEMMRSSQRSFSTLFGNGSADTSGTYFDSISEIMRLWSEYMTKANQMQELMYRTSSSAWEKVLQSIIERAKNGESVSDYKEFYNEWSAINEKEFVELFNTDEYAALQAELIKLNSELNRAYEKQMEIVMQPFPVVNRSQLDDLYKINHELRTKLNDLERMVADLQDTIRANSQTEENQTEG